MRKLGILKIEEVTGGGKCEYTTGGLLGFGGVMLGFGILTIASGGALAIAVGSVALASTGLGFYGCPW